MKAILNIAYLTTLESIRKKVFYLVLLTIVAVCAVSLTTGSEEMVNLSMSWSLSSIHFFGVLLVMFIAGTSLPEEFQSRRVVLLLSKPINRVQILFAKFLGFLFVLAIYLVSTGLITFLLITGVHYFQASSGASSLTFWKPVQATGFEFSSSRGNARFQGRIVDTLDGERVLKIQGRRSREPYVYWEFPVKRGASYVRAPELRGSFTGRGPEGQFAYRSRLLIEVPKETDQENNEWRTISKGQDIRHIVQNQQIEIPLPWKQLKEFSRFRIRMGPTNPATQFRFHRDSFRLFFPTGSFLFNYMKAILLLFLMFSILVGLLLVVTPVFSSPVSIFLGLSFYVVCSSYGFLQDALETVGATIQSQQSSPAGHSHLPSDRIPGWLLEISQLMTRNILQWIPDFRQFLVSSRLLQGEQVLWGQISSALTSTGLLLMLFLGLGSFFFLFREVN